MQSAPLSLKLWLGTMALTIGSSLLFVRHHPGARAVFGFTALGLLFTKWAAPQLGLTVFSGLVALTHTLLWPFGLYFLCKDHFATKSKVYKLWIPWTASIILVSLFFDFRDAFKYLTYLW